MSWQPMPEHCCICFSARSESSRKTIRRKKLLLPGYTCYSVAAAVVKAGLKVALYDLDPRTFQPDFEDVRRKINAATLAVVGQHLLGVKADIKELTEIAHQHGVCCIEDSAQRLEADQFATEYRLVADYTLFSFGRGKPLPLGGGGALIAREQEVLSRVNAEVKAIVPQSANRLLPFAVQILSWPRLYWVLEKLPLGLGRTVYDPGFEMNAMSPFHQRIGDQALADLEQLNQHRENISRIYSTFFGGESMRVAPHIRFPVLLADQRELHKLADYGVRRLYPLSLINIEPLQPHLVRCGEQLAGSL